jgi:hypothetical protein
VPIPKRSAAPRATSTLSWWIVSQKVLDLKRPIREADLPADARLDRVGPGAAVSSCSESFYVKYVTDCQVEGDTIYPFRRLPSQEESGAGTADRRGG